ncbi:RagB/SusD family nutrient uptake outer membrane protein [Flammeovirga sp. EKP202]|uniref:RagB/SusD family nutrient uptake outer membrane protein n=1 Tax=Flammeovirga sp. EKP202 TaxID=2770592 RepID=UPI00165FCA15|nr:RagB/SusD family nutrient uptake outer membrane protein [Flammeovirga sp. EKP202]MBD0403421.1 RagB/SusD family nutrient uptake outer membrane protein [Flammeovirga sp. EKP202]
MNLNSLKKYIAPALIVATTAFTSCLHQLDTVPVDPNVDTKDKVYQTIEDYNQGLAKLYAGYAVTGQQGPDGNGDLGGIDEGASQYLRRYWEAQELPTDEAINCWGDPGQPDMSTMTWSPTNTLNEALYYRVIYQISLANQFIRDCNASDFDLSSQIAEARFLRAYSYWHALDLYGNGVPMVTEENAVGAELPMPWGQRHDGDELFNYISSELEAIIDTDNEQHLVETNESLFGQANIGVAYMVLTKLYLNAPVYLNASVLPSDYLDKAETYVEQVLNRYALSLDSKNKVSAYQSLFLMDNYEEGNEVIFSINYFGNQTRTWGGMTYLINAATGGGMDRDHMGLPGWGGNRSMTSLGKYFENVSDDRNLLFYDNSHTPEISNFYEFSEGVPVMKFRNVDSNENKGDASFAEVNYPVFRVADAMLMQAEIKVRKYGTHDQGVFTRLWARANRQGQIPAMNLTNILAERARELYWEGHRRQDLRRFNSFTSSEHVTAWPYKGTNTSTPNGINNVDVKYELYPIPSSETGANPNLNQNPGY